MNFKSGKRLSVLIIGICVLLISGCCTPFSASLESMPALVRTDGTVDLMDKAVAASGYADTGLGGTPQSYGQGPFQDYLTIQSDPLSAASYVLNTQKEARRCRDLAGMASFGAFVLEKAETSYDTTVEYVRETELKKALALIYEAAGQTCPSSEAQRLERALSPTIKKPLARWLSAAAEAYTIIQQQTGHIAEDTYRQFLTYTYTPVADSQIQALDNIRQTASFISEDDMRKAGALVLQATVELVESLKGGKKVTRGDTKLVVSTPLGELVFGSTKADRYESPAALLLLDPSGNDTYTGRVAANASREQCISVAIDMVGDDTYDAGDSASQGSGILGIGLLLDGEGNDSYTAQKLSQGCSLIGVGMLMDGGGDDQYTCHVTGQASGLFGTALLVDADGDDSYQGYGFVQASAGNRCTAYLVDGGGNDRYEVPEETPTGYSRLDYGGDHAGKNGAFSQGCGWGQRVISSGGIAGGIAGMLDFDGDDTYSGGLWVQGTGYWSGIGFVYNEKGNDRYEAYYYSQASVAHYGAGMVMDTEGNDVYYLKLGAGLSFVWDRGVSLLVDDSGNDSYFCPGSHGAVANSAYDKKGLRQQDQTYAIFVEAQGDDTYYADRHTEVYGFGRGGYFLDADGQDTYQNELSSDVGDGSSSNQPFFHKGGVFMDDTRSEEAVPYIGFWEEAKAQAGFAVKETE